MNLQIVTLTFITLVLKQRSTDAVFNGNPADIVDFPYMASLCYFRDSICSGAIISERHYLTAGHCLFGRSEANHYIVAGAASILDSDAMYFSIKRFHLYPEYKDGIFGPDKGDGRGQPQLQSMQHDIGIIEIEYVFPLKPVPSPQPGESLLKYYLTRPKSAIDKIPWAKEFVGQCTACSFAGWGSISSTFVDIFSFRLMSTTLFISICPECLKGTCLADPYTFCVHDPKGRSTPGRGDSGGPLVCNGVIAGVFSKGAFNPVFPSRFTDVALYKDWIAYVVNQR